MDNTDDFGKSSTGFDENVVAMACYFGFLGVVILFLEKRSNFVKFHAVQSTMAFCLLGVFWLLIKTVGALYFMSWAPGLLTLAIMLFMFIKTYYGDEYKLPIIGNRAFNAVYETHEDPLTDIPAVLRVEEPVEDSEIGKSSTGFDENLVAMACYIGFLGFIILFLEKRSNFVKFHALQSTIAFCVLGVFWLLVRSIGALSFMSWAPGLLILAMMLVMFVKTYNSEEYKLPIIGNTVFGAIYETREDLLVDMSTDPSEEEPVEDSKA
jgi:uncharacterized membrane protein